MFDKGEKWNERKGKSEKCKKSEKNDLFGRRERCRKMKSGQKNNWWDPQKIISPN